MDGTSNNKTQRRGPFSFQTDSTLKARLICLAIFCQCTFSGCALPRNLLLRSLGVDPALVADNKASAKLSCTSTEYALAPEAPAASTTMTEMPVPPAPANTAQVNMAPLQSQDQKTMQPLQAMPEATAVSNLQGMQFQNMPSPQSAQQQIAQQYQASQSFPQSFPQSNQLNNSQPMLGYPPAGSMWVAPGTLPVAPGTPGPAAIIPVPPYECPPGSVPAHPQVTAGVNRKLNEYEAKLAELQSVIEELQGAAALTNTKVDFMTLEQLRQKQEQDQYSQKLLESQRDYRDTLDSVSEFLDQITTPESAPPTPEASAAPSIPQQSNRRSANSLRTVQRTVNLPAVD